jgi:structural maintenance of chromosome 1
MSSAHLKTIQLKNFKSYGGEHEIGPFSDFSSIIGPNGSGKSNLLDAASFVMCAKSSDLRSSQMKDLIHRPPGSDNKKRSSALTASVSILIERHMDLSRNEEDRNNSTDLSPVPSAASSDDSGSDEESETMAKSPSKKRKLEDPRNVDSVITKFERIILPSGAGEYRVDDKKVTFKQYKDALAKIGVSVDSLNFLVFQGDVEAMALKKPHQMAELLEQVSGSKELKQPYEEARKEKEEADRECTLAYEQQKALKVDRRLRKEQKEEAERFTELQSKRSRLIRDDYMWQIHQMEMDRQDREQHLTGLQGELEEKENTEKTLGDTLKKAKAEASSARKETRVADKRRDDLAAKASRLEPSLIQLGEEIKTLQAQIAHDKASIVKSNDKASKQEETVKDLEAQLREAQENLDHLVSSYEAAKREAAGPDEATLTHEQEEEYQRLKEFAVAASVEPRRQLDETSRRLESARAVACEATQQLQEAKAEKASITRESNDLEGRRAKVSSSLKDVEEQRKKAEQELKSATQEEDRNNKRRAEIDIEIEKINNTLREIRDDHRKSSEEVRLNEAVKGLQDHIKGVHGRLVTLCHPTQRRYRLAATVSAGKNMDAIVVDNQEVASECIRHLRDQRAGIATFLPLNKIQGPSPESTERIRAKVAQDGRFRMVADVISCDDSIRNAVLFAVGNTVVCDDLDSARELCFGRGNDASNEDDAIKAVTLDGHTISASGSMTGGITNENTSQAGRWNEHNVEELRQKKEALEAERHELDSSPSSGRHSMGGSSKLVHMKAELETLHNKNEYAKSDLEFTRKTLLEKKQRLKAITNQTRILQDKLAQAEKDIEDLTAKQEKAKAAVKAVEDEHLGDFLASTGLKDVRAYEQATRESREEFTKNKRALTAHIAQLEEQMNYESTRDFKKPIKHLEKKVSTNQKKLAKAKAEQKKLQKECDEAKSLFEESETVVEKAKADEADAEENVRGLLSQYKEAQSEKADVSNAIAAEESALEKLRGKLHETLQKARVEEVQFPMLEGSGIREEMDVDDDDDASPETSQRTANSELPATQFSQGDHPKVLADQHDAARIDFSELPPELKQPLSDREERKVRKDFDEKRMKIDAEIESITPNMKASEAYVEITDKLKSADADFQAAKEKSRKTNSKFQKIKNERSRRFMTAYEHIQESLKEIYKDMTKSSKHPLGGDAFLSLDNEDEPFNSGIKFNAMPPMKRYFDMDKLSGGEKSMASLSLLFAIQSFCPAPFLVLDECDAALDNGESFINRNLSSLKSPSSYFCLLLVVSVNVRKLCNYIHERSRKGMQCVVISLKDIFFEKSDVLVGICKDVGTNSSRALTLDLLQYDKKGRTKNSSKSF